MGGRVMLNARNDSLTTTQIAYIDDLTRLYPNVDYSKVGIG